MSVDTRNGVLAIIASVTGAAVILLSLVGILVLAVHNDGQISNDALDTFKQLIFALVPAATALGVTERVVSGIVASKAIANGAHVSGSPISVTPIAPAAPAAPAASEPSEPQAGI